VHIAQVATRHFLPVAIGHLRERPRARLDPSAFARPLRLTFEDLGGTFIKFGQIMASSPGMFGEEVAQEFRSCLDTGPAAPFADVRVRIEEDLGMSIDEAYASLTRSRSDAPRSRSCIGPRFMTAARSRSRSSGRGSNCRWPPISI
jgi:predicted unusual protein kinase regulating ubiquinone biosynthesis (AarF/ABC1/UbiB family)